MLIVLMMKSIYMNCLLTGEAEGRKLIILPLGRQAILKIKAFNFPRGRRNWQLNLNPQILNTIGSLIQGLESLGWISAT